MRLIALLLASAGLAAHADSPAPDAAAALDRSVAEQSFDQVWDQVRTQYFDYSRIETDWIAARSELRPKAAAATGLDDLRAVLNTLLDRIGESHFGVLPAEFMNRLDQLPGGDGHDAGDEHPAGVSATGFSVRVIDGQIRVTRVRPDGAAWQAGIRPGWSLQAIDGEPIDALPVEPSGADAEAGEDARHDARRSRLLLEVALHSVLAYPDADRTLALRFLDPRGETRSLELAGTPLGVELTQLGRLPPMPFEWRIERIERGDHCATVLAFSAWVPELNRIVRDQRDALLQCPGLILDLRGNLGGVITTMVPLAAELFDSPAVLGSLLRGDGQIDFRVLPRRVAMDGTRLQPFQGPVAILIDRLSASTSEMFAAGMQAVGRARLFGETTAGMALPAQMLPLASGDWLMYAFADYRDSGGRRIEGVGVNPDEAVHPAGPIGDPVDDPIDDPIDDPFADEVLERALQWIALEHSALPPDAASTAHAAETTDR